MFTIGQFSKITGLTVKTIRFYHEQRILTPRCVDPDSGYRYYDDGCVEKARVVRQLRELDFSLDDIANILASENDCDVLDLLERHRSSIDNKLANYRSISASLERIIENERREQALVRSAGEEILEKVLEPITMAAIRMRGQFSECGKAFGKIGRKFGRHLCGKPFIMIYDSEFKEDDADFEVCMPVRQGSSTKEIDVRTLDGGTCLSTMHRGPYDKIGRAYQRIIQRAVDFQRELVSPCREIYIKGPGMIFKGNPENYLTEVQMLFDAPQGIASVSRVDQTSGGS